MRRFYLVILSFVFMLGSTGDVVAVTSFSDVADGVWFEEHVEVLVDKGIIAGYPDGEFKPYNQITVEQFIKTMVVALGYNLENGTARWSDTFIAKARELKLIDSFEYTSNAALATPITRGQMAKICERTIAELDTSIDYKPFMETIDKIKDKEAILNTPYGDFIGHMYEIGVITGYTDNTFKPSNTLTRAEAATVIRRVIDESIRQPYVEKNTSLIQEPIGEGKVTFYITIDIYNYDLEPQYEEVYEYLLTQTTKEDADEIMEYVKTKTYFRETLESRYWDWGNEKIEVLSEFNAVYVIIRAY